MYMDAELEARKRYQENWSYSMQRYQSWDRRQQSLLRNRYDPRSGYDRFKAPGRKEEPDRHDWLKSQPRPPYSPRCIWCKCESCVKNTKTLNDIKYLINKKLDVKMVNQDPPTNVNLCETAAVPEDMVINYTYTDQGRQMMILDPSAPSATSPLYMALVKDIWVSPWYSSQL